MKKINKLVFLIPLLTLTSCRYSLDEVYRGNYFNSTVFQENYFTKTVNELRDNIDEKTSVDFLLDETDKVFTSYDEMNVDLDAKANIHGEKEDKPLDYSEDYSPHNPESLYDVGYGPTRKMSRIDNSFKYGHVSKLFDGQMFCHGRYQNARVQINENGFDHMFKKELVNLNLNGNKTYFALNFKAAVDYTKEIKDNEGNVVPISHHYSKINLKITFYLRQTNDLYKKITTSYVINDVPTNPMESFSRSSYVFYGFEFNRFSIDRLAGFSISYDLLEDEYVTNYNLDYTLLLYEMFIPFTSWM